MNKFKVGDKVKVIRTGKIETICKIYGEDFDIDGSSNSCYIIYICDDRCCYTVHDLELIEEAQELLTEEEKEYLSNVIKPFRKEISYINKVSHMETKPLQYIMIWFKNNDTMCFPDLNEGKHYKNMGLDIKYTLEELRI